MRHSTVLWNGSKELIWGSLYVHGSVWEQGRILSPAEARYLDFITWWLRNVSEFFSGIFKKKKKVKNVGTHPLSLA